MGEKGLANTAIRKEHVIPRGVNGVVATEEAEVGLQRVTESDSEEGGHFNRVQGEVSNATAEGVKQGVESELAQEGARGVEVTARRGAPH